MRFPLAMVYCVIAAGLVTAGAVYAQDALTPQKVAAGVYAFIGEPGEIAVANRGFVANSGFVIGSSGVVVIDTGSSYRHGRRMLEAIARTTDKPVKLVILTHAVQEFLFGSAAFEELGIPIIAHRETAKLMQARCEHCLARLKAVLGSELEGTRLVLPRRLIDATTNIDTGGRRLQLVYLGWASTPGDLAVIDLETRVLFAGGMVSMGSIPDIRDSDFEGWQRALQQLTQLHPARVVPGHGPVADAGAITETATYLDALDRVVKDLYAQSSSLLESVEKAALPAYHDWALYGVTQRQNALHRYLQLELQELGADPRSTAMPER